MLSDRNLIRHAPCSKCEVHARLHWFCDSWNDNWQEMCADCINKILKDSKEEAITWVDGEL